MDIYLIQNTINDKVYVGKTEQPLKDRWQDHLVDSVARSERVPLLYRSMNKHGADKFFCTSVAVARDKWHLNELEKLWICVLQSAEKEYGYNLTLGGTGGKPNAETLSKLRGRTFSEAHRKRISEYAKWRGTAHMNTPETRDKKRCPRKPFSDETRAKMSLAAKNRCTPGWKRNLSLRMKVRMAGARNPMFGSTITPEHQAKMRAGALRKIASNPEKHRVICSNASRARWDKIKR